MAIVIEQEKKTSGMWGIFGWLAFAIAVVAAGYYLFLAPVPEATDASMPNNLGALQPITDSGIQPSTVAQSPAFQLLHTTIAQPTSTGPAAVKRTNPFIAP